MKPPTNPLIRIGYCAHDLKGVAYELLLDRVNGTILARFKDGWITPRAFPLERLGDALTDERTLKTDEEAA